MSSLRSAEALYVFGFESRVKLLNAQQRLLLSTKGCPEFLTLKAAYDASLGFTLRVYAPAKAKFPIDCVLIATDRSKLLGVVLNEPIDSFRTQVIMFQSHVMIALSPDGSYTVYKNRFGQPGVSIATMLEAEQFIYATLKQARAKG